LSKTTGATSKYPFVILNNININSMMNHLIAFVIVWHVRCKIIEPAHADNEKKCQDENQVRSDVSYQVFKQKTS
jgi:hypothetical protein